MGVLYRLPFETEIYQMEEVLARLEAGGAGPLGASEEVRRIRRELVNLKRRIYGNLTNWQTVLVARHPQRPQFLDYLDLLFEGAGGRLRVAAVDHRQVEGPLAHLRHQEVSGIDMHDRLAALGGINPVAQLQLLQ